MKGGVTPYSYSSVYNNFIFLLPKINGKGYVKAPFGGQHANENYKKFVYHSNLNIGDVFDCDGYVLVENVCPGDLKSVMDYLSDMFPRITGWEDVGYLKFMDMVIKNGK